MKDVLNLDEPPKIEKTCENVPIWKGQKNLNFRKFILTI